LVACFGVDLPLIVDADAARSPLLAGSDDTFGLSLLACSVSVVYAVG
jgi:hypothetical protein